VSGMIVEKREPLDEPRIESTVRMARNFPNDVRAIFEPLQIRPRRRRPDRFFAFFAVVSVLHGR